MAMKFPIVTALSSCSMRHCTSPKHEYFLTYQRMNESLYISCTVADLNVINIVAAKAAEEREGDEEDEEEEFVKYGGVDEFYDLDKEIGK